MSPEVFLHDDVSPGLDIYSFGIIRECCCTASLCVPAAASWPCCMGVALAPALDIHSRGTIRGLACSPSCWAVVPLQRLPEMRLPTRVYCVLHLCCSPPPPPPPHRPAPAPALAPPPPRPPAPQCT